MQPASSSSSSASCSFAVPLTAVCACALAAWPSLARYLDLPGWANGGSSMSKRKAAEMAASVPSTQTACIIEKAGPGVEPIIVDKASAVPECGPDDVLVRNVAAGVNYIDTYQRSGLYKVPTPFTLGREGAGHVARLGAAVADFAVGDRVAYFAQGAYAEYTVVPAKALVRVPAAVSLKQAACVLLQGLTAHYLVDSTYAVQKGDWVLVHAGAGGTGRLIIQMAKLKGATVIATVGPAPGKVEIAKAAGADHVIRYDQVAEFSKAVRELRPQGVEAVYDGVGKATFPQSLASVAVRGTLVAYGNASGAVPPVDPLDLMNAGSVSLVRPTLASYLSRPGEKQRRVDELFKWLGDGAISLKIAKELPLAEARAAHTLLESRKAAGKIVLLCGAPDEE